MFCLRSRQCFLKWGSKDTNYKQKKKVVAHSTLLACEIPWTEEPGRLQFMGSQRAGYGLVTNNNKNNKSACQLWVVQILPTNSVFLLLVFCFFSPCSWSYVRQKVVPYPYCNLVKFLLHSQGILLILIQMSLVTLLRFGTRNLAI